MIARHGVWTSGKPNLYMTTALAKADPYSLMVCLDEKGHASGEVFLDDGVQQNLDIYSHIQFSVRHAFETENHQVIAAVGAQSIYMLSSHVTATGKLGKFEAKSSNGNFVNQIEINDWSLLTTGDDTLSCSAFIVYDLTKLDSAGVSALFDVAATEYSEIAHALGVTSLEVSLDAAKGKLFISVDASSLPCCFRLSCFMAMYISGIPICGFGYSRNVLQSINAIVLRPSFMCVCTVIVYDGNSYVSLLKTCCTTVIASMSTT